MFLKSFVALVGFRNQPAFRARIQGPALAIVVAVAGILPGIMGAACVDWYERGAYETVPHYLASAWKHWQVATPAPEQISRPAAQAARARALLDGQLARPVQTASMSK